MKIPEKIRIKNNIIKISTVSKAEADKGNFIGLYNTEDNTIKIKEGIKDKKLLLDVVLHEILHAILDISNKRIRSEEPTVNFLATGLARVFMRNKSLVDFIKRCQK